MKLPTRFLALVTIVLLPACSASQKQAWRESGSSWKESGKQTLHAVGESVDPEGQNRKEEWKQVGRDLGEAGKDTGRALGKSVDPNERRD